MEILEEEALIEIPREEIIKLIEVLPTQMPERIMPLYTNPTLGNQLWSNCHGTAIFSYVGNTSPFFKNNFPRVIKEMDMQASVFGKKIWMKPQSRDFYEVHNPSPGDLVTFQKETGFIVHSAIFLGETHRQRAIFHQVGTGGEFGRTSVEMYNQGYSLAVKFHKPLHPIKSSRVLFL